MAASATAAQQQPLLRAYTDPVIFGDDRVFRTLLQKQAKYIPPCTDNDLASSVASIGPELRREVAGWMLEVCEHHQSASAQETTCPPEVFCLAMNYVDRFLGICSSIARSQLQLLGAVCLMVAWKVREHEPLPAQKLVEYSDHTLTLDDIMEWEVLLLSKLDWDMCSIIAFDFVEHIIQRLTAHLSLPTSPELSMESVRSSSEALITMCSGHQDFSKTSPCLIASACVYATLKAAAASTASMNSKDQSSNMSSSSDGDMSTCQSETSSSTLLLSRQDISSALQMLTNITSLSKEEIEGCAEEVDVMVRQTLAASQESSNLVLSPSAVTSTPRRLKQTAPPVGREDAAK